MSSSDDDAAERMSVEEEVKPKAEEEEIMDDSDMSPISPQPAASGSGNKKANILSSSDEEMPTPTAAKKAEDLGGALADLPPLLDHKALFGDEQISSSSDDEEKKAIGSMSDASSDIGSLTLADKAPESPAEPEVQKEQIKIELPFVKCDFGQKLYYVKLPNFLSIESRPFVQEAYEEELAGSDVLDEEGRARVKMRVESTMRWAYVKDSEGNILIDDMGQQKKMSNARILRWDDGTMSLALGKEIFDIQTLSDTSAQSHLYIQQSKGLVGQAVLRDRLTFRPVSTQSSTHMKMTLAMAEKSKKVSKVKMLPMIPGNVNPDIEQKKALLKEKEILRNEARMKAQKARKSLNTSKSGDRRRSNIMRYLEEDEDEDEDYNVRKIKQKSMSKEDLSPDTSEADEEEEEAKGSNQVVEHPSSLSSTSDEEELEERPKRKAAEKKKKIAISSSDDD